MTPSKQAFTLVEIMIVVMIIGLLASVALPAFEEARAASQQNACINNLRQIEGSKSQVAIRDGRSTGYAVGSGDVNDLLDGSLDCPGGGTYTYGAIGTVATCTLASDPDNPHTLVNYN